MKTTDISVGEFLQRLAGGSATPGGGSVAALSGALSAALCAMVGRLTIGRTRYREGWAEMEQTLTAADRLMNRLLDLVDQDIEAYNRVMAAFRMPKETKDQKTSRQEAIQKAIRQAAVVPMETLKALSELTGLIEKAMAVGNPNCFTDAGVAAVLTRAAALGAAYNVRINLSGIEDQEFKNTLKSELEKTLTRTLASLEGLRQMVEERLG